MDEIDPNNIVQDGRRTRGRVIDWAKAAEENPAEDDDEDYEDVFGKANGTAAQPMQTLQLNTRLSNKSWGVSPALRAYGLVACRAF